jgi:FkbM family methyltransferase
MAVDGTRIESNDMRAGFLTGALRRASSFPKLMWNVRGWSRIVADAMGRRKTAYPVRTRSGCAAELRGGASDWWIFLEVFVFGIYRRVAGDVQRSQVIIDIGANVGLFALYAASLNRNAQIHAFEPFPANFKQMERNLALNPGHLVKPHLAAVAETTGTATLYFTPGDDSGCSLSQTKGESCTVNTVGINELFQHCQITRCDLLKMDCEGSELALLETAKPELLASLGAVIMEYHKDAEVPRLCEILTTAGLKPEVIADIHTLYARRA